MTGTVPGPAPAAMSPDICSLNWKGLFAYLRRHHGEQAVQRLVEGLVGNPDYLIADKHDPSRLSPVSLEHLEDPFYWVSNEFSLQLLANVKQVVPGPEPLRVAGEGAVLERLSRIELLVSRVLGPEELARKAQKINARFNRTKEVRLAELHPDGGVMELHYRPGFRVTRDVCRWNLGIYSGMVKASGSVLLRAEETGCVLAGDACCAFSFTWDQAGLFKRLVRMLLFNTINDLLGEYERAIEDRNELIAGLTQEIAQRRQAQELLEKSEERYRDLFNGISDVILSHDLEGRILDINPAVVKSLGYAVEEVIGKKVTDIMPPGLRPLFLADYLPRLLATGADAGLVHCLSRAGQERLFEYRNVLVANPEQEPYVSSITRDVTERVVAHRRLRQMQDDVIRARKMEAVGNLASGIAHDFNNLLQAISGFTQVLLARSWLDEETARGLTQIDQATQRGADLVKRIISFGFSASDDLRPLDLNAEVSRVLDVLTRTIPKMVEFRSDLAGGLKAVKTSASALEQVLLNLALNANDAMPAGGQVSISTRNVALDPAAARALGGIAPGAYVRLRVADTGQGMAREVRDKIFDPFFTTKPHGKGSGLGLFTVYGIVRGHQGYIACESQPGQGTSFDIYLPATDEPVAAPPIPGPDQVTTATAGETVLMADDEAPIRYMLHQVLSGAGYAVAAAGTGEEALAAYRAKERPFDLVILDLGMPGMGGQRCLETILGLNPGQKAIIASGYAAEVVGGNLLANPGVRFIQKPYRFADLLRLVRALLGEPPAAPAASQAAAPAGANGLAKPRRRG
ncbi:MAG: ATP-binding protein [Pseudomonadota bacterium]